MDIFIDTEFTDLSSDAKLISIGMIANSGEKFYVELTDTWTYEDCSEFVKEVVLPLLDALERPRPPNNASIYHRLTLQECRFALEHWIASFMEPVQFWSDSPSHDWKWIRAIFANQPWPVMLLPECKLLMEGYTYSYFSTTVESIFISTSYRHHHALDDAIVNQLAWLKLKKQKG